MADRDSPAVSERIAEILLGFGIVCSIILLIWGAI